MLDSSQGIIKRFGKYFISIYEADCSNESSMKAWIPTENSQSTVVRDGCVDDSLRKLRESLLQQRERLEDRIAVIRAQSEDMKQRKNQSPRV